MRKRILLAVCSMASLSAGAVLYGLYRQDTYIGALLGIFLPPLPVGERCFSSLAAFYLPDFLWMFSMSCALFAVLLPQGRAFLTWCILAFSMGATWELMQHFHIISGTADVQDVILYSLAVISAAITKKMIERICKK